MFQNDNDDDGAKFFFYDIKTKDDLCHAIPLIIIIEKKNLLFVPNDVVNVWNKTGKQKKKIFFSFFSINRTNDGHHL